MQCRSTNRPGSSVAMTSSSFCWCMTLAVLVVLGAALPREYLDHDLEAAASGHHHGRVQIKVYRGPDEHHGHHHEHFAPHGYWIKQPADDHHH